MSSVDQEMVPKAAYDALVEQLSTLQATVDRLTALLEEKNQIILNQNRARFGQSSEKRTYLLADGQLSMFEQAGDGITEKSADEANSKQKAVSVTAHTRKPKRKADNGTSYPWMTPSTLQVSTVVLALKRRDWASPMKRHIQPMSERQRKQRIVFITSFSFR